MSTHPPPRPAGCPPWCVIDHGTGDARDGHHSAGIGIDARVRPRRALSDARDPRTATRLEVGLSRPPESDLTWLIVEDGGDQYLALTVEGAQMLARTIHELVGDAPMPAHRTQQQDAQ